MRWNEDHQPAAAFTILSCYGSRHPFCNSSQTTVYSIQIGVRVASGITVVS